MEVIITNKAIVIINGSGGCGKSTFCKLCEKHIKAKEISTVDKIKEAFKLIGWDGETKTEEIRTGLSNLKDYSTEQFDHPFKYIKEQINDFLSDAEYELLFVNSREPNEIKRFTKKFNCITLHIINPNVKPITSNHADANTNNYNYDYTIYNNGTLKDFENQAQLFIKEIEDKDVKIYKQI
mgnify:CR=1 FL=1